MNVIDFMYSLIDKFSPMDESSRTNLRKDAREWYLDKRDEVFVKDDNKKTKEGFDLKSAPLKQKVVYWCENWMVRTGLAVLFIFIVPMIQDWYTSSAKELEDEKI